jgi:hypothetical protein
MNYPRDFTVIINYPSMQGACIRNCYLEYKKVQLETSSKKKMRYANNNKDSQQKNKKYAQFMSFQNIISLCDGIV